MNSFEKNEKKMKKKEKNGKIENEIFSFRCVKIQNIFSNMISYERIHCF
tara:strand:- start:246 stop:392 length:147 start_codon:yes stop_codon:yes gene_type:complete